MLAPCSCNLCMINPRRHVKHPFKVANERAHPAEALAASPDSQDIAPRTFCISSAADGRQALIRPSAVSSLSPCTPPDLLSHYSGSPPLPAREQPSCCDSRPHARRTRPRTPCSTSPVDCTPAPPAPSVAWFSQCWCLARWCSRGHAQRAARPSSSGAGRGYTAR
jgi:hypothetical protein